MHRVSRKSVKVPQRSSEKNKRKRRQTRKHSVITDKTISRSCLCKKKFTNKSTQQKYLKTGNQYLHRCGFCGEIFSVKKHFIQHLLEHNTQKLEMLGDTKREEKPKEDDGSIDGDTNIEEGLTKENGEHAGNEESVIDNSSGDKISHKVKSVRSGRYCCAVCGKEYSQKGSLTNHEASHAGRAAHKCQVCEEMFDKKSHMLKHGRQHLSENPPVCCVCHRTFKSDNHLKMHLSVHRDFTCEICGKKFTKQHHLKFHQFCHTRDRPVKCETCGKTFKNNYGLKTHQLAHTDDRRHVCELCGKAFKISSHLHRHIQGHSEMRNFRCEKCGKCFKQNCHLKVHLYSHSGERRFHCDVCGKGFTQNSYLEKHKCALGLDDKMKSSKSKIFKTPQNTGETYSGSGVVTEEADISNQSVLTYSQMLLQFPQFLQGGENCSQQNFHTVGELTDISFNTT